MSISASQWGSPLASRRAFLIHGLTSSSDAWVGIAQRLVAEGFFVIAPNLLGHGWRQGSDYRVSALAEDLLPYFAMDTSYDVIVGHSLGGTVALSLLPFLPKEKETIVILSDPPLEIPEEKLQRDEKLFYEGVANPKSVDELMVEHPTWPKRACVLRALGISMFAGDAMEQIFLQNRPWSFSGLLNNIPSNVKMTVLIADPKFQVCHLEDIPRDVKNLNVRVLPGITHAILVECPDAIFDAIPPPRA